MKNRHASSDPNHPYAQPRPTVFPAIDPAVAGENIITDTNPSIDDDDSDDQDTDESVTELTDDVPPDEDDGIVLQ